MEGHALGNSVINGPGEFGDRSHPGWSTDASDMTFTVNRTDDLAHPFSRGTLKAVFTSHTKTSALDGISFHQSPSLVIEYQTPQPLEIIRKDLDRLQSLTILCIDRPSHIDKIILHRADVRQRALSGEEWPYPQDIELRGTLLRYTPAAKRAIIGPDKMLLTFDALGGIPAVAAWLDRSAPLQRILDTMISIQHRDMYMENRFLNIIGAAEAFQRDTDPTPQVPQTVFDELLAAYLAITPEEHHDWLRGKIGYGVEPALWRRLQALSRRAGKATADLVGSNSKQRQRWAVTVAKLRNWLAHVNVQSNQISGGDLRILGDSVYAVLRVCLLIECGIDQETLNQRHNSPAHRLTEPIDTVVNRVYSILQTVAPEGT